MSIHRLFAALGALCVPAAALATGDAARGAQAFRTCAACHSLAVGEHRTGPSLGDGESYPYWEFNLRFKSDSCPQGPRQGEPVILGTGMGGDRAQVVFAAPGEISTFIRTECR
jgi:hypothetical protein